MYAPLRLDAVLQEHESQNSLSAVNSLDTNKVFRGKLEKKLVYKRY